MDCFHPVSNAGSSTPPFFSTKLQNAALNEKEVAADAPSAMNQLSTRERELVMFEIHGVNQVTTGSTEFQQEKLRSLTTELAATVRGKSAFTSAQTQNPQYTIDPDFRLLFLRSTDWNVKESAQLMLQFFRAKFELFGQSLLTSRVTFNDLSPEVQKGVRLGFIQVLPFRDTAGRAIVVFIPSLLENSGTTTEDMLRAAWYTIMSASADIETSMNGLVVIHYLTKLEWSKLDRRGIWQIAKFQQCLPYKFRAAHICDTNTHGGSFYHAIFIKTLDAISRVRILYHSGSHLEVVYKLQTFGIQERILPLDKNGMPTREGHQKWLSRQQRLETDAGNIPRVLIPTNKDVLKGRGRGVQNHVGNLRFRHMVAERQNEYDANDMFGAKGIVANKVMEAIESEGGRFLKDDGIGWVRLEDTDAREKISMTFRSQRKDSNASR
mmetsp:Transcript_23452/g.57661  ORF Transcript_23452/g.57661 Transcript_23452/m.57661 type:complete len:437 (-) Transcript_23452:35-1345(-)